MSQWLCMLVNKTLMRNMQYAICNKACLNLFNRDFPIMHLHSLAIFAIFAVCNLDDWLEDLCVFMKHFLESGYNTNNRMLYWAVHYKKEFRFTLFSSHLYLFNELVIWRQSCSIACHCDHTKALEIEKQTNFNCMMKGRNWLRLSFNLTSRSEIGSLLLIGLFNDGRMASCWERRRKEVRLYTRVLGSLVENDEIKHSNLAQQSRPLFLFVIRIVIGPLSLSSSMFIQYQTVGWPERP
jgi:hypothetical protein